MEAISNLQLLSRQELETISGGINKIILPPSFVILVNDGEWTLVMHA